MQIPNLIQKSSIVSFMINLSSTQRDGPVQNPEKKRPVPDLNHFYLPTGNPSGMINLERFNHVYSLRWYNPRTGEFEGDDVSIQGGQQSPIGAPPQQPTRDWVVLIRRR